MLKLGIAAYMHGRQTELLPEPISKQPHGIVLHRSGFSESGFVDYARSHHQFIPKTHVDEFWGSGILTGNQTPHASSSSRPYPLRSK